MEPRLAEARAGKRAVYFVDASHFVLASFLGWVWCVVRAASGRQRYNVLGALDAATHALVTEVNMTYITATSVCALLGKIASRGGAVPITLVLDKPGISGVPWSRPRPRGWGSSCCSCPRIRPT